MPWAALYFLGSGWVWLGLLGLAVPILVHRLARNQPPVQRLPTLRFLEATPPVAVQPARIRDRLLLAVRLLVLALAVLALARPVWDPAEAGDPMSRGRGVWEATVVERGIGWEAVAGDDGRGGEAGRAGEAGEWASQWQGEGTDPLGAPLASALAWLERAPEGVRKELRLVGRFPLGSLSEAALGRVPPEVGLTLERGVWEVGGMAAGPPGAGLRLEGGTDAQLEATRQAAMAGGMRPLEGSRRVVVRLGTEGFSAPPELSSLTVGFSSDEVGLDPWMGEGLVALESDPLIRFLPIPLRAELDGGTGGGGEAGEPAALRLLTPVEAGTPEAAALLVAMGRAFRAPRAWEEDTPLEPEAELVARSRPARPPVEGAEGPSRPIPTDPPEDAGAGQSAARILWGLVLLLLGVEGWIRRGRSA
jgi:hypothetical protein